MGLRITALTLAAAVLAGCSSFGLSTHAVRPPPPDPKTQLPALEQRIYELVEAAREKIDPKATPLKLDSELTSVARAHSKDMATKHYLGHRAPDGQTSATIIMARDANFQGLLGENIAAQYYTKEGGIDVDAFAKRFVKTWMKSKTHRQNLAFPEYQRTGVGAAIDGHEVYVTQLFSASLDLGPASKKTRSDHRTVSVYSDPATAKAGKRPGRDVRLRKPGGTVMLPVERPDDGQDR